jgi:amidase
MHPDNDLAWLTATEIVARVRDGRLDPQAVVQAHLERIRRVDPGLGAYVHVDDNALAGAGPIAGVTLAVKDTQPVAGMPWTWGSRRWRDRVATEDAIPVARMRAAGATVLGKTNLPELAASVGTVNELFPPTHNPWRRGWTPGGSSGGSGAAVAAGLCVIAFGDDMGGSVRIPSSCCGVAGLRTSPGLVPDELPSPIRLSSRGPLARSVADLRLALAVMTGRRAPAPTTPTPGRIAVVTASALDVHPACRAAAERAAGALEAAGHRVTEATWDPLPVAHAYQVVRPASVSTMPGEPDEYGPAAGRLIAQGRALTAREYLEAHTAGLTAARLVTRLLDDHDAVLTPTLGLLPMPIADVPPFLEDAWTSYTQFVLPVSFAGTPAVSVPAGEHDGLPIGVQLVGAYREEWALLDLAEQLERADGFGFRRPPAQPPMY